MHFLRRHLGGELLQRGDVVQDPEAPPVGGNHQIVEVLLDRDVVDRRMRQVALERLPQLAIIERDVERVLGAQVEEPAPNRIFLDPVGIAERRLRNPRHDQLPGLAVVGRLEDPGIAVVHLVAVHRHIGSPGIVA